MEEPLGPASSETFRSAVAADFRASSWLQRFLLVGVVFWLGYEWGAGNETLTPWILVRVISSTSGATSVVATGLVGFGFTVVQQLVSGFTTSAGFTMFHRTAQATWRRLSKRTESETLRWEQMGWGTRAVLVFSLGTTATVLIQIAVTGEVGVARHRRTILMSATLLGSIVGTVGALVAAMAWGGRSVAALATATDWLLRVLGNPLLWIGLLIVLVVVQTRQHRT